MGLNLLKRIRSRLLFQKHCEQAKKNKVKNLVSAISLVSKKIKECEKELYPKTQSQKKKMLIRFLKDLTQ
jgi:hypothetical protein